MKHLMTCTAVAAILATTAAASAQTTDLRIFLGGQQRPDVMEQILALYEERNPDVNVEIEVGGATSEQQQQYLNTVLASRDATLDVVLIDVIRPAQWAAAEWAERVVGHAAIATAEPRSASSPPRSA